MKNLYIIDVFEGIAKQSGRPFVKITIVDGKLRKKESFTTREDLLRAGFLDDMVSKSLTELVELDIEFDPISDKITRVEYADEA